MQIEILVSWRYEFFIIANNNNYMNKQLKYSYMECMCGYTAYTNEGTIFCHNYHSM